MSRKKIIWSLIAIVIVCVAFYSYKEYIRTNKDLGTVEAELVISAIDMVSDYEKNDSVANVKFLGKVIEVAGMVKNVQQDEGGHYTIVLGETVSMSSIRCAMDSTHQQDIKEIIIGSPATIRGACTGFNKDDMGLGSDVILNRCVIIR